VRWSNVGDYKLGECICCRRRVLQRESVSHCYLPSPSQEKVKTDNVCSPSGILTLSVLTESFPSTSSLAQIFARQEPLLRMSLELHGVKSHGSGGRGRILDDRAYGDAMICMSTASYVSSHYMETWIEKMYLRSRRKKVLTDKSPCRMTRGLSVVLPLCGMVGM